MELIDLTGDDDVGVRVSRPAALGASSRLSANKPAVPANVKPIDLDAVAGSTRDTTVPTRGSNHHTGELSLANASAFYNTAGPARSFDTTNDGRTPSSQKLPPQVAPATGTLVLKLESSHQHVQIDAPPRPDPIESKLQNKSEGLVEDASPGRPANTMSGDSNTVAGIQAYIKNLVYRQQEQRACKNDASITSSKTTINTQSGVGFGSFRLKPLLPGNNPTMKRSAERLIAALAPLESTTSDSHMRRTEPPSVTPQERKRLGPRRSSEAQVSTTAGSKLSLEYEGSALAEPPVSRSPNRLSPPFGVVQSPKPHSRSPETDLNNAATTASVLPSKVTSQNEDVGSASGSSGPSASGLDLIASQATVQTSVALPGKTRHNSTFLQARSYTESVSPTMPSFPAEFDRGRFPYQRRRRGAKSALNPWISKGHHKKPRSSSLTAKRPANAPSPPSAPFAVARSYQRNEPLEHPYTESLGVPTNDIVSPNLPPAEGSQIRNLASSDQECPQSEAAPTNLSYWKDPSQSSRGRQTCGYCIMKHCKCDHSRPTCACCAALQLVCHYDGLEGSQESPEDPVCNIPMSDKPPLATTDQPACVSPSSGRSIHGNAMLDAATQKVAEKANDSASKRFDSGVDRLDVSPTAITNINDVACLQPKVNQISFKEASNAGIKDMVRTTGLESSRDQSSASLNGFGIARGLGGATETNDQASNASEPLTSLSAGSTSSPDTSSPPEAPDPTSKSHRSDNSAMSDRRPSRSAAHTAASRISSQFGIQPTAGEDEVHAPTAPEASPSIFPKRLCPECDRMISAINFKVHLSTKIHKQNAQRASEGRQERSEDHTVQYGIWDVHCQTAPSTPVAAPSHPRSPSADPEVALPSIAVLQAQRKAVQGTFCTSLAASIAVGDPQPPKPYKGRGRCRMIDRIDRLNLLDQGQLLQHVDFTAAEIEAIKGATVTKGNGRVDISKSLAKVFADRKSILMRRDKQAIEDEIKTLEGPSDVPAMRKFTLIESRVKDPNFRSTRCVGSLLRHRELGSSGIGRYVETRSELRIRLAEDIRPWRSFVGASHDVVSVAWAPNSIHFAAGAVAHSNPEDLQYNRPCNLLFGDLLNNTVKELPDHRVDRQMPQTGRNAANQDLFNACDPKVYKTVTSVKFDPQGKQMYTASEDMTVKFWDLSNPAPKCMRTWQDDANVTSLDISHHQPGVFATASKKIRHAIRVFEFANGEMTSTAFSSSRAELKPELNMYPECLHWGPTMHTSHLLLGGFQQYGREIRSENEGHLCLWDVNTAQDLKLMPAAQAIHTAVWHPTLPYFASGGAPGSERTDRQKTRTVVRVWDLRHTKRVAIEYECHAQEMTDVAFSPKDPNIVTAGCTNRSSYVWDWRWPQQPLHTLRHERSVMPYGEKDTGVMMSLWGTGASLYYTGSSDGSIRAWDVRRHPNDVLIRTVAQLDAGIQSGAFSPDGTHLLVGDATGHVHVLSSAPWEPHPRELAWDDIRSKGTPIDIIRAPDGSGKIKEDDNDPGTEGIEAGRNLILTGQVAVDPVYGPGKGPNYDGPYALHAREEKPGVEIGRLKKEIYKQQPLSRDGHPRPAYANPVRVLAAARKELLNETHHDFVEDKQMDLKTPGALVAPGSLMRKAAHSIRESWDGLDGAKKMSTSAPIRASDELAQQIPVFRLAQTQTPAEKWTTTADQQLGGFLKHSTKGAAPNSVKGSDFGAFPVSSHLTPEVFPETDAPTSNLDSIVQSQPFPLRTVTFDEPIPESEMVEENGWWPQLGEKEIAQARARPWVRLG